jgi:hypothetical protein
LVKYGEESGKREILLVLPSRFARNQSKTVSDLSFLANIHTAKEIAKREGISNIFALKIAMRTTSIEVLPNYGIVVSRWLDVAY